MLVLSRKSTETIEFPELGIRIEVLKTSGGGVRLGVTAPEDIRILRGELSRTDQDILDEVNAEHAFLS